MATWGKLTLTNEGKNLIARSIGSKTAFEITRVTTGRYAYADGSKEFLKTVDGLASNGGFSGEVENLIIKDLTNIVKAGEIDEYAHATLMVELNNNPEYRLSDVTTEYPLTQIGVFGRLVGDKDEHCYMIIQYEGDNKPVVPLYSTSPTSMTFAFNIAISDTESVVLNVTEAGVVTQKVYQQFKEEVNNTIDVLKQWTLPNPAYYTEFVDDSGVTQGGYKASVNFVDTQSGANILLMPDSTHRARYVNINDTGWTPLFRMDSDNREGGSLLSNPTVEAELFVAGLPVRLILGEVTSSGSQTAWGIDGHYFIQSKDILNNITVTKGGTGRQSLEAGKVLVGNGINSIKTLAIDDTPTSGSKNLITSDAVAKLSEGIEVISSAISGVSEDYSGFAFLDKNGKLPVSNTYTTIKSVVEGNMDTSNYKSFRTLDGRTISVSNAELDVVYFDTNSSKSYVVGASRLRYVPIPELIIIGDEEGTAYDGALGKEAHDMAEQALLVANTSKETCDNLSPTVSQHTEQITDIQAKIEYSHTFNGYVDNSLKELWTCNEAGYYIIRNSKDTSTTEALSLNNLPPVTANGVVHLMVDAQGAQKLVYCMQDNNGESATPIYTRQLSRALNPDVIAAGELDTRSTINLGVDNITLDANGNSVIKLVDGKITFSEDVSELPCTLGTYSRSSNNVLIKIAVTSGGSLGISSDIDVELGESIDLISQKYSGDTVIYTYAIVKASGVESFSITDITAGTEIHSIEVVGASFEAKWTFESPYNNGLLYSTYEAYNAFVVPVVWQAQLTVSSNERYNLSDTHTWKDRLVISTDVFGKVTYSNVTVGTLISTIDALINYTKLLCEQANIEFNLSNIDV